MPIQRPRAPVGFPRVGPAALLLVAVCVLLAPAGLGQPAADWDQVEAVPLVEDLDTPANIDVAPDGTVWYAEIEGNVSTFDPATGATETVYHVDDVKRGGERGLVGMALAHDVADSGAFYLYYTEETPEGEGGINRLVRVVDGQETQLATVPAAEQHNGGRILVTPNGTLFVGTGENLERDPAQDPDSHLGKVLRMTPHGEPIEGNLQDLVYSLGHRNVYGLAWDPDTQTVWATENSGWRRDEVNILEAGANYGYPECEGYHLNGVDDPCPTDKGYTFPIATFYEDRAAAPTDAVFWQGDFYWASFNEGSIHHLDPGDPNTRTWNDTIVFEHEGPILDLAIGPEERFYVSTIDGVWQLVFPGDDHPAQDGEGDGSTGGDEDAARGDGGGDRSSSSSGGLVDGVPAPSLLAAIVALGAAAAVGRAGRPR